MPPGTDRPRIDLHPFGDRDTEVEVLGARLVPLAVPHGPMSVYGFRVGGLGFVTDAKALPPAVVTALEGVDTLVLNALWWGRPHPTHFNVEEAVAAARAVGARRTYLIHLTHRVRHAELEDRLPADVRPAYDGLSVEV
jgi:phosphoribosyl 1,2-cyclic phosphate phosphodiesterase